MQICTSLIFSLNMQAILGSLSSNRAFAIAMTDIAYTQFYGSLYSVLYTLLIHSLYSVLSTQFGKYINIIYIFCLLAILLCSKTIKWMACGDSCEQYKIFAAKTLHFAPLAYCFIRTAILFPVLDAMY